MAFRRVNPLDPAGLRSTPTKRLGQGFSGGRGSLSPSLIDPMRPGASLIPSKQPRIVTSKELPEEWANQLGAAKTYALKKGGRGDEEYAQNTLQYFRDKNIPEEFYPAMEDIVRGRREYFNRGGGHPSVLGLVGKGLGSIEAAGAGFLKGSHEYETEHDLRSSGDWWKFLAHPAHIYKDLKAGFSEVPDAVKEGYRYEDLIKDTLNPNSFAYRYSMPVGLGMAIFFDPTTYVTFGATSASKSAAYHLLAEGDRRAAQKADQLIKKNLGKTIHTIHGPVTADYDHLDEILSHVKVESGSPFTLGDALDQLHGQGLAMKEEIRRTGKFFDPKMGEVVEAGARKRMSAFLLPTNVKGGRGVRMAGLAIPGTPQLGEKLGQRAREKALKSELGQDFGKAIIPQWGARHVVDDAARASALVEMSRFRTSIQQAQSAIGRDVRELQRVKLYPEGADLQRDEVGFRLTDYIRPTPQELADEPYRGSFPVIAHPTTGEVMIAPESASHGELLDHLGNKGQNVDEWNQGRGIFDPETGEISHINWSSLSTEYEDLAKGAKGTHSGAVEVSPELQEKALQFARQRFGANRDEILHNLDIPGPKSVLVRPEQRANLLDIPDGQLDEAQRILKNNIHVNAEVYIENAVKAGLPEKEIRRLWDSVTDFYEDPLLALAEFKFKSTARTLAHQFVNQTLSDRRFAIPMAKYGAEGGEGILTEVPKGFTEFNLGGRRFAVRNSIIDGIRDLNNPMRLDTSLQRGFRRLNIAQNWWKLYATSPNPAFHVMNFLGATWNNALAGIYNPMDYFDAMATLYKGRREEAAEAGAKFGITRQVPKSTPGGQQAKQVLGEAEARSGLGRSSFLFGDISRGHYSAEELAMSDVPLGEADRGSMALAGEAMESGKGFIKGQLTPQAGRSKKRTYGVTLPRKVMGVGLAATMNPMAIAMFMPEMARAGRRVGGTIEDLVRLAPFMKFGDDPAIRRVLAEYGPINSELKIIPTGFTKRDQQIMYDIGAHISRQFQFDYTNLTNFERYIAKSVFPFWTYYKNNMALQIQQLAKAPRTFGVALKTMNYIDENGENYSLGPWKEILPAYFENLQAFQIPVPEAVRGTLGLPKDQPMYLNPKLPFLSINLVPNLWDILRDPKTTSPQKMREIVAPIAGAWGPLSPFPLGPGSKILLEAGTGYNLGLNRPIDYQRVGSGDMRQGYVPAPSWFEMLPEVVKTNVFHSQKNPKTGHYELTQTGLYVLEQLTTPFINNLGQSIPIQGATETETNRARANMVSWLSGVRLMPVDILRLDRNAAYDLKNRLEAKQTALRRRGEQLPMDEQTLLARTRADLKMIEFAYDQRENPR